MKNIDIKAIIEVAKKAGKIILDIYENDFSVEFKKDNSPLTIADKRSNNFITNALKDLYPDIPIVAEEGPHIPYEKRKDWAYLWLVDPLDGTKEFINKNGEFTINIALIYKGNPIFGIVYAPVKDVIYYGLKEKGAYKIEKGETIKLPIIKEKESRIKAIVSRSHYTKETKEFIEKLEKKYGEIELIHIGSALKLCFLAEGIVDIYPRFAPTMEWDTAAGHAVISEAKGELLEYPSLKHLKYNKERLVNPWFIAKKGGIMI